MGHLHIAFPILPLSNKESDEFDIGKIMTVITVYYNMLFTQNGNVNTMYKIVINLGPVYLKHTF